jgi:hypothetical protein
LNPDIEVRGEGVTCGIDASRCLVVARVRLDDASVINKASLGKREVLAHLVDIVLNDGGPNHGGGTSEKAHGDLFQRAEVDSETPKRRVDLHTQR